MQASVCKEALPLSRHSGEGGGTKKGSIATLRESTSLTSGFLGLDGAS